MTKIVFAIVVLLAALSVARIDVSVMLPLDVVTADGLTDPTTLLRDLRRLASAGADGVMTDVWWGLVERVPRIYNFSAYLQLAEIVKASGLRLQVVLSFHACGGNVGDACNVTLPEWTRQTKAGDDVFYTDPQGNPDLEYLSLGVDDQPLFTPNGRTAVQVYADFMRSFARTFASHLAAGAIDEIQVGMGPAGELRYPGYQLSKWSYCGIGEFQCIDPFMLASLARSARERGHPEWGNGAPDGSGSYDSRPNETMFFTPVGANPKLVNNFQSEYGRFFLGWYSDMLIRHGSNVLSVAHDVFAPFNVALAGKISGIHWHYGHPSHAAESTTGYYNSNGNNGYSQIAAMFKKFNVTFDFTCLEMKDDPSSDCDTFPEQLVKQTIQAAFENGIPYSGENAIVIDPCPSDQSTKLELCSPDCYRDGFVQIVKQATKFHKIERFTYLRLTRQLVDISRNLKIFKEFVDQMHAAV